jgi:hypothetical protein
VLKEDARTVASYGIQNNDMINLHVTNLNSADQDLMQGFFSNMNKAAAGPKMSQKQLLNQMFHNAQNMRVKQECDKIKAIFGSDEN